MTEKQTQSSVNPFNPEALKLKGGAESFGVEKKITRVPCQKPNRQAFVRVHPDESYRLDTATFVDKIHRETYMVAPGLRDELVTDITPVRLYTAVDRHKNYFLWPCSLPAADGRSNPWHETALDAADAALEQWVSLRSNMTAGCYDIIVANGNLPEPEWPELTFEELLRLCFQQRYIDDYDHSVLKSLRGEV